MFRTLKKPINILPFIESFQIRQNINQLSAQLKKKKINTYDIVAH